MYRLRPLLLSPVAAAWKHVKPPQVWQCASHEGHAVSEHLENPVRFRQRSGHSFGCARCGYRAAARGAGRIMECIGCGSTAVSERSERTAQG